MKKDAYKGSPRYCAQTDEELMRSVQRSDEDAFHVLAERYVHAIYSFIFRFVKDSQTSEDLTQEVFQRLWRYKNTWDGHGEFKRWVYTIARNVALTLLRKRHRAAAPIFLDTELG